MKANLVIWKLVQNSFTTRVDVVDVNDIESNTATEVRLVNKVWVHFMLCFKQ